MIPDNLTPEDPNSYYAVELLEDKFLELWRAKGVTPVYEGRNAIQWIQSTMNRICQSGSIRLIEKEDFDA